MLLMMAGVCTHTIRQEIISSQIVLPAVVQFMAARMLTAKSMVETKVNNIVGNLMRRVVAEHQR
jgi:hypothetical protein